MVSKEASAGAMTYERCMSEHEQQHGGSSGSPSLIDYILGAVSDFFGGSKSSAKGKGKSSKDKKSESEDSPDNSSSNSSSTGEENDFFAIDPSKDTSYHTIHESWTGRTRKEWARDEIGRKRTLNPLYADQDDQPLSEEDKERLWNYFLKKQGEAKNEVDGGTSGSKAPDAGVIEKLLNPKIRTSPHAGDESTPLTAEEQDEVIQRFKTQQDQAKNWHPDAVNNRRMSLDKDIALKDLGTKTRPGSTRGRKARNIGPTSLHKKRDHLPDA